MFDTIKRFNDSLALLGVGAIFALIGADAAFNGFTLNDTFTGFLIAAGMLILNFYYRKAPPVEQ